jgi:formiminoglutamase
MMLPHDSLWPRSRTLFSHEAISSPDVALVGVPAHSTSISPTAADKTPAAIRACLERYSLSHSDPAVNMSKLTIQDCGDVISPDIDESRTIAQLREIAEKSGAVIALGGDNSITYAGFSASSTTGLITFDAHYDLRDGINNGSPVRRLIEAGLDGRRVVQIGIADFSNSPEYAARARDYGITVIPRSALRASTPAQLWQQAVAIAGSNIYVDFDIDICDRSVAPACPAAAPGGITADELRQFAFLAGSSHGVKAIDITEIDATKDSADERTVRLGSLVVLEFLAGFSTRA